MIQQLFPWWAKIIAKIILSRIPFSYQFWSQRLGVFQHGDMLNAEYAWKVFESHYSKCRHYLPDKFVVCEIGPGDSLATALIAPCYGALEVYLVDVDNFANNKIKFYAKLVDFLTAKQLSGFYFNSNSTWSEFLVNNNAQYLTNGLDSLKKIPDNKINFAFSQAVLEHINLEDFSMFTKETYRILKPGGVASHKIDLKDHLVGGLNNLRFSKQLWESRLFSKSGFYTNRLRKSEIVKVTKDAGFEIVFQDEDRWEEIPIFRKKLDADFSQFSDDDLLTAGIGLVVRK